VNAEFTCVEISKEREDIICCKEKDDT